MDEKFACSTYKPEDSLVQLGTWSSRRHGTSGREPAETVHQAFKYYFNPDVILRSQMFAEYRVLAACTAMLHHYSILKCILLATTMVCDDETLDN